MHNYCITYKIDENHRAWLMNIQAKNCAEAKLLFYEIYPNWILLDVV